MLDYFYSIVATGIVYTTLISTALEFDQLACERGDYYIIRNGLLLLPQFLSAMIADLLLVTDDSFPFTVVSILASPLVNLLVIKINNRLHSRKKHD